MDVYTTNAPWGVTNPSPGIYQFTNNTDNEAVMVFFQQPKIVGVELRTDGSARNSVDGRIMPGGSFEVRMNRLPHATGPASVEIEWMVVSNGVSVKHTWDYVLPD